MASVDPVEVCTSWAVLSCIGELHSVKYESAKDLALAFHCRFFWVRTTRPETIACTCSINANSFWHWVGSTLALSLPHWHHPHLIHPWRWKEGKICAWRKELGYMRDVTALGDEGCGLDNALKCHSGWNRRLNDHSNDNYQMLPRTVCIVFNDNWSRRGAEVYIWLKIWTKETFLVLKRI